MKLTPFLQSISCSVYCGCPGGECACAGAIDSDAERRGDGPDGRGGAEGDGNGDGSGDGGPCGRVSSDEAGLYLVPSLAPGDYKIVVQSAGFGMYTVPKLQLDVDQMTTVNAQLSVDAAGTTVEVSEAATVIVADTITVGSVLDQRTVQEPAAEWAALSGPDGVDAGRRDGTERGVADGTFAGAGSELVCDGGGTGKTRSISRSTA